MNMSKKLVKRGQCILIEKPWVYALKSKFRTDRCDLCFKEGDVLKCSSCQYVFYCNRSCQKESWAIHKHECKFLKKILPRIVPDAARIIGRILVKLENGGADIKGYYSEHDYRKFKDLMPHTENLLKTPKRIEHIQSLAAVLHQLFDNSMQPSFQELVEIYGRMIINSFNILDNEMNSIGTAIYLGASICDHSCQPNAIATFNGTTLHINAIEEMPALNWSKIRISYIDLVNPTIDRQMELKENYFFCCDCERCKDKTESIKMNAAACPNLKCHEPQYFQSAVTTSECQKCEMKIDKQYVKLFNELLDCTKMHINSMKDIAYLDVCQVMLKKQKNIFHSTNVWNIKTLDMAFESSINVGKLDLALEYGHQLVDGLKKYGGLYNPILGLVYMKIGKIQLFHGQSKEALRNLNQASDIILITHGREHNLYRQTLMPLLIEANIDDGCS